MTSVDAVPRVLVVDDEPVVRDVLEQVVVRAGAHPHVTDTGAAARKLVEDYDFACAIIDKNLPDEPGLTLLEHLKEVSPKTEILVVTGYANLESAIAALRLGALDYVIKPFDLETITHRVKLALDRRRLLDEQQRLERVLLQSDRLASLGTLVAGAAHEINNPLAFLLSNLEYSLLELPRLFAEAQQKDDARFREVMAALGEARQGADRVREIVRDLKIFARSEDTPRGPVDLKDAVETAVKLAMPEVRLRAELVQHLRPAPKVDGHAPRLSQLVLNLVLNAAQAITPGSRDKNEIRVELFTDPCGWAALHVTDTGAGIPEDQLDKVFDPFYSTKRPGPGTGLGLSTCQGIVVDMGGQLCVESQVGKGSVFKVVLPPSAAP